MYEDEEDVAHLGAPYPLGRRSQPGRPSLEGHSRRPPSQRARGHTGLVMVAGALLCTLLAPALRANEYPTGAHYLNPQQQQQLMAAQARVGGLDPSDYVDEAGELEVLVNQQQIPTAQLMAAAGHVVPDNFFLPGGSVPAMYGRPSAQQAQVQQQQQQQQQAAPSKFGRPLDLLVAASNAASEQADSLVDVANYNLMTHFDNSDMSAMSAPIELRDLAQSFFEQQQQQNFADQQAALMAINQQQQQQQQDNSAQSSEQVALSEPYALGPAYQISTPEATYYSNQIYGLPTKSSSREPQGMLKPLGNPKTVSSPLIDLASQLPKTSNFEKLAEKIPNSPVPTVFSFASAKDPSEKVKSVNHKKRNVVRQAEQLARAMIKSVNEKLGTSIGDQSDLPFLLSSIGPLGFAQNLLFDPTLLVTLLNSAEKTYLSDVLPGPAKSAIRPVLNIFRVPNKKRDRANLLNIISYLASGSQGSSGSAAKHRQALGIEKQSAGDKKKSR